MNFYLIYGTDKSYINKEIDNIINKYKIDINDIVRYNFNDNSTDEILEEASINSMFSTNKLIIIESNLKEEKIDTDKIENYMNNFNKNTYIIIYSLTDKVDTRKKIFKLFSKNGKVEEVVNNKNSAYEFVKESLKENNYSMSSSDINYLLSKINNNINNIENELNKLYLYKIEDKIINRSDIDELVVTSIDDEIFALANTVINNEIDNSLKLYNEFINRNYEITQMIGLLANQFRFLYQVKNLYNNSKTQEEISKILDVHPYRVKLAINNIYYYTESDLLHYINRLATLDRKIKLGEINKNIALELFLINKDI